jgi:hypothetical protein
MDIEAIGAHETPTSDHAANNISNNEASPDAQWVAWRWYAVVRPS